MKLSCDLNEARTASEIWLIVDFNEFSPHQASSCCVLRPSWIDPRSFLRFLFILAFKFYFILYSLHVSAQIVFDAFARKTLSTKFTSSVLLFSFSVLRHSFTYLISLSFNVRCKKSLFFFFHVDLLLIADSV